MGTNFYIKKGKQHIGKRAAAGWYCWDCGMTLCKAGEDGVHCYGKKWYTRCQSCGKPTPTEAITDGAIGRELGFNRQKPKKKTGIASCASFLWACEPMTVLKRKFTVKKPIVDSYNKLYSLLEFKQVLQECPIQRLSSTGSEFS